jgi:predicted AAA+ superfamily ATPase
MESFGCVEVRGPKWCGKTWTALSHSASATRLDDPSERAAAELDPRLALVGDRPHLVDEWQEIPEVWDAARRLVDDSGNRRGLLLLTGSTSLSQADRKRIRHTGAGRIARLRMRPMSLVESGLSSGLVSLQGLLNGSTIDPVPQETELLDVARWICRGGWPANVDLADDSAMLTASQYIQAVLDVNVLNEGRSPALALALMRALAVNQSQNVTHKTLARDMSYGEKGVEEATIVAYLELLDRLFLTEELPGWEPPMRAKARVRVKPKRYFTDPSLGAALMTATPRKLLSDAQTFGLLFEALVIRDLRVFLSTYTGLGNDLFYYRDDKGLEVDAIIEYGETWAGVEIKLSETKIEEAVANLTRLRDKVTANPAARHAEPAFLAVIVGRGHLAYTRPDGIHVIPVATLNA